jgi:hypothetical protein
VYHLLQNRLPLDSILCIGLGDIRHSSIISPCRRRSRPARLFRFSLYEAYVRLLLVMFRLFIGYGIEHNM